jgi:hypothetical protein
VTIIDLPSTNLRPPPGTDRESGILLRDGALIDWQPPMGLPAGGTNLQQTNL